VFSSRSWAELLVNVDFCQILDAVTHEIIFAHYSVSYNIYHSHNATNL
jgi:hypothetical protein